MFRHRFQWREFGRGIATAGSLLLMALLAQPAWSQGFPANQLQPGTNTSPSVASTVDPATGIYFGTNRTGISGHLESGDLPIPVLSACGTTPTLATGSTDMAGTVTMGTTATGCVITFGTAYTAAPSCTVTWRATPLASQSYVVAAATITTTQTSTSNNLLDYFCVAKTGG